MMRIINCSIVEGFICLPIKANSSHSLRNRDHTRSGFENMLEEYRIQRYLDQIAIEI